MNEYIPLILQSGTTDGEVLHLALAALAAIFSGICAVGGVAVSVLVKRAITKWFAQQDSLRTEVKELRSALESATRRISAIDGGEDSILVQRSRT